jgi:hypothetical protein
MQLGWVVSDYSATTISTLSILFYTQEADFFGVIAMVFFSL